MKPYTGWRALLRPAVLDRIEQAAVVVLFIWLVERVWVSANPFAPLLVVAELSVLIFVLIRRPTEAISLRLGDWLLAITATTAPLLIQPTGSPVPQLVALAVALIFFGNLLQVWAKLVLRRSFGIAPANRGIKRSGPYRLVRHPIYAGYLIAHIGVMMVMPSLLNLTIYIIGWWAQVLRLLAEERLLSEDPVYAEFKTETRWRLIPGVF